MWFDKPVLSDILRLNVSPRLVGAFGPARRDDPSESSDRSRPDSASGDLPEDLRLFPYAARATLYIAVQIKRRATAGTTSRRAMKNGVCRGAKPRRLS